MILHNAIFTHILCMHDIMKGGYKSRIPNVPLKKKYDLYFLVQGIRLNRTFLFDITIAHIFLGDF